MSSSLSSIILIGVVWLLIITTLFVRRQSPVRRTTKALSETRVVHEGGTSLDRVRRRPLPAESLYRADPDSEIELVEAEPEQVVIDDTEGFDGARDRDPVVEMVIPAVIDGDVVEYRTLDDEDTGEFPVVTEVSGLAAAPRLNGQAGAWEDSEASEDSDVSDVSDVSVAAELAASIPSSRVAVAGDAELDASMGDTGSTDAAESADFAEFADSAASGGSSAGSPRRRFTVVDDAYIRGGDIDVAVGTDDELPLTAIATEAVTEDGEGALERTEDRSDAPTEDDLDYAASRRGRGIYDPVASRTLAERRQRRRLRVLAVLATVTLLSLVGAVTLGGKLWAVLTLGVLFTLGYLYSLRKQTVAERELQRRRLARMRRARLGVRNTDDHELGVPDRLLRPGAVVLETDDIDPEFAELDYAGVTFAGYEDSAGNVGSTSSADSADSADYDRRGGYASYRDGNGRRDHSDYPGYFEHPDYENYNGYGDGHPTIRVI